MKMRLFLLTRAQEFKKGETQQKVRSPAMAGDTICDNPPRKDDAVAD